MEQFVVSARKYRPQRFEDVVGQAHVAVTIKNAIRSNHLAQSFLFCGPRGVGKTTCARILAKTINCETVNQLREQGDIPKGVDIEACDECNACRSFNDHSSFNIHELDAASNNSVDDMRSLIEQVRYAPQSGRYKIYIIDEVHMLSKSAFNAFLKTLEEPPPYAIFILATTEKQKIIPTILSRCQIFDFNRITVEDIVGHLQMICEKESINADENALHTIALKADGALRDALSIFDRMVSFTGTELTYKSVLENLNILDYDYFFKIQDALLVQDHAFCLSIFDEVLKRGFEGDDFILGLSEHFRNLLVCKHKDTIQLLEVTGELRDRYKQQADRSPVAFLLSALQISNDCATAYGMSKNKRLHVEIALLKLSYLNETVRLVVQEQGTPDGTNQKKKSGSELGERKSGSVTEAPKKEDSPRPKPETAKLEEEKNSEEDVLAEDELKARQEQNATAIEDEPEEDKAKEDLPKASGKSKSAGLVIGVGKDFLEDDDDEEEEEESYVFDENVEVEIPEEALDAAWEKYRVQLQEEKRISLSEMMDKVKPERVAYGLNITLGYKNAFELFHNERVELLAFMRKELDLPQLQIKVELDESKKQEQETKPLTPKDKYDALVAKNPKLEDLKDQLGLDFDY